MNSAELLTKIDAWCVATYGSDHRKHLGASVIGMECSRALYYIFRWAKQEQFTGRMHRLFQRGHLEEQRFVDYLDGVGFTVSDYDSSSPVDNETGMHSQHRVSDVMGHFGGSLDGIAVHDETGEEFLTEFKTSGTGAKFKELKEKGVRKAKPQHFAQMCIYGFKRQLKRAIYMSVNKNDDDLHVEIVDLDWAYGAELVGKAHSIIMSPTPPNRIAASEAYHVCKFCHFKDICHNDDPMEKSCRSCRYSNPTDGATWSCSHHGGEIPSDFIPSGCDNWEQVK